MSNNADHELPGWGLLATIFTIGSFLVVITTHIYNVYPRNGILEVLMDIFFPVGLLLALAAIAGCFGRIAERLYSFPNTDPDAKGEGPIGASPEGERGTGTASES